MKYLVIGAGGTGGPIGAYMARAGKDVTLIARGEHLKKIQESGLMMDTPEGIYSVPVKACDMEHYRENPDVIFVCVKAYSLDAIVLFMQSIIHENTVIIPILNVYGTGERLQKSFAKNLVTDGCIYIAGEIKEPGCIWLNGTIFRIVFGARTEEEYCSILEDVKKDLDESGIEGALTHQVKRDTMKKYSYIASAAACGEYYHAAAGAMQKPGEIRDTFAALLGEIGLLSHAMGIEFDIDIVQTNLDILDSLAPTASTSMQRDVAKGKVSEMDGLVFNVLRMADQYKVTLPTFEKIAAELKRRGF